MPKWQVTFCRVVPLLTAILCLLVAQSAIINQDLHTADLAVRVGTWFVLPLAISSTIYTFFFYKNVRTFWVPEESKIIAVKSYTFTTDTGKVYASDRFERNLDRLFPIGTTVTFFVNPKNEKQYCLARKASINGEKRAKKRS